MFKVEYAIQNKKTKKLLCVSKEQDSFLDGDYLHSSETYELDTSGITEWKTDNLIAALAIMSFDFNNESSLELPFLSNSLKKDCEVVAIHSFNTNIFNISLLSTKGIEQDISNIISDEILLLSKCTSANNDLDSLLYKKMKKENLSITKLTIYEFYQLCNYLKNNNLFPVIECDVKSLKKQASEFVLN